MPAPGLSPMSRACCLQRSSFPSAAGFFLLTQAKRSGPCGYIRQSSARELVEMAQSADANVRTAIAWKFIIDAPYRRSRPEHWPIAFRRKRSSEVVSFLAIRVFILQTESIRYNMLMRGIAVAIAALAALSVAVREHPNRAPLPTGPMPAVNVP
jgi:hypothetical protein